MVDSLNLPRNPGASLIFPGPRGPSEPLRLRPACGWVVWAEHAHILLHTGVGMSFVLANLC